MVKFLTAIANAIDTLNEYVGRSVAWLTLLLVLLVCYDVANRSIFNSTKTWIMELEWHLFSLIFILGAGYALKHNKHVRVDLFFAKFSRRDQAWTNLIGAVVFLIPWCCFLIYYCFEYAHTSYLIGEGSPNPGGLPAWYPIKFALVLGIGLLLLQAISECAKSVLILLDNPSAHSLD